MADYNDKLSFDEIVRYLFTGLMICVGYLLITKTSLNDWYENNKTWADNIPVVSLVAIVILCAGYIMFQIYRSILYPYIIIFFRAKIGFSPKYNYFKKVEKSINSDNKNNSKTIRITPFSAEDFYEILRRSALRENYTPEFPKITTAVHMIYCNSIILFSCSVYSHKNILIITSFILFIVALVSDRHYESMEVNIIFKRDKNTAIVKDEMEKYLNNKI